MRLEAQHRVFQRVWSGRLFFPPIEYPRRILDLGYGLGDWATNVAETYEDSEVRPFSRLFISAPFRWFISHLSAEILRLRTDATDGLQTLLGL